MPPSGTIVAILEAFRPEFTEPTWTKVLVLLWGTVLARGRRTVAAALRAMGLGDAKDFSKYHQVFNRAVWSPLRLARRLTCLSVQTFGLLGLQLCFVIDETLERRWGRCIRLRGHYRDPLASSKTRSVAASGIRWIVLALVVKPPWTSRSWALPILSLPSPTPKLSVQLGRRHKTIADWARQMILCLRRWLPEADLTVVGDQAYSVIELGLCCRRHGVRLIAPLRLDARLFASPPPRPAGTIGRPRKVGHRQPKLAVVLTDPTTAWERVELPWYDGTERVLEIATGTALWYKTGQQPLPIRWVLSRDPRGVLEPRAYFSTGPEDTPASILARVVQRWPIETTFEEARAAPGDRDATAMVRPGDRAGDALPVGAVFAGGVVRTRPASGAPHHDPHVGVVSQNPGDVLRRAGRGTPSLLGLAGYSDFPTRCHLCGNPQGPVRLPDERRLLLSLKRTKSS